MLNNKNLPSGGLPVYSIVRTWLVLAVLLYLAVGGFIVFSDHGHSDLVTDPMSVRDNAAHAIRAIMAYGLLVLVSAHLVKRTMALALKMKWLLMLVVLGAMSFLWSDQMLRSFAKGILLVPMFWFAIYLVEKYDDFDLQRIFIALAIIIGVLSICTVLAFPSLGIHADSHAGSWRGIFTEKNGSARTCLFILAMIVSFKSNRQNERWLKNTAIALMMLLILMSFSLTGAILTVTLFILRILLRLLSKIHGSGRLLFATAALSIGMFVASIVLIFHSEISLFFDKGTGLSGRQRIWAVLVQSIAKHPYLGYGYDGYWRKDGSVGESTNVYELVGWGVTGAHNGYLSLFLNLGLSGISLFAAGLWSSCINAYRTFNYRTGIDVISYIPVVFLTLLCNVDESSILTFDSLPWLIYMIASARLLQARRELSLAGQTGPNADRQPEELTCA